MSRRSGQVGVCAYGCLSTILRHFIQADCEWANNDDNGGLFMFRFTQLNYYECMYIFIC